MINARLLLSAMLGLFLVTGTSMAGSLTPSNAPAPSMHSLEEIYQEIIRVHDRITPTTVVYSSSIVSTLAKTRQTTSFQFGDDGTYQRGASIPFHRFEIIPGSASNCVADQLTGLIWLRNPSTTPHNWSNAILYCESLSGDEGRGGFTDWRLPNINELLSLIDARYAYPSIGNSADDGQWAENDPFNGIQSDSYWSSTTYSGSSNKARIVNFGEGVMNHDLKTLSRYVLAVRGESTHYYYGGGHYGGSQGGSSYTSASGDEYSVVTDESGGIASGGAQVIPGRCLHLPILPGSFTLLLGSLGILSDDGGGNLSGPSFLVGSTVSRASGKIIYNTGTWYITLEPPLPEDTPISLSYAYLTDSSTTYSTSSISWGSPIVGEADGTTGVHRVFFNGGCDKVPINAGSLTVVFGNIGNFRDDSCGRLAGQYTQNDSSTTVCNATGTIDYNTGIWTINLASGSAIEQEAPITLNYQSVVVSYSTGTSTNAP